MLISRMSPKGGRPLGINKFPLAEDKMQNFGLRLGYLETGEPILIALRDAEEFAKSFCEELNKHHSYFKKTQEIKEPWKVRLAKWILKEKGYQRLNEQLEREDN